MPLTSKSCVDDMFMEPANRLLNCYTRNLRKQKDGLTGELFLRCGVQRAREGDESGREFLQTLADQPKVQTLARSTWFDAFKSSRRLSLITEVVTKRYHHFERVLQDRDWLRAFPELKDFPVWAVRWPPDRTRLSCHQGWQGGTRAL
jgi:hypothetical protein